MGAPERPGGRMGGERDPARSKAGLFDGESLEEGAELPPPDPPLPVGAPDWAPGSKSCSMPRWSISWL